MIDALAQGYLEELLKMATKVSLTAYAKTLAPKANTKLKVKTPKIAKAPYAPAHSPTGSAMNAELQALKGNPPPRSSVSSLP